MSNTFKKDQEEKLKKLLERDTLKEQKKEEKNKKIIMIENEIDSWKE